MEQVKLVWKRKADSTAKREEKSKIPWGSMRGTSTLQTRLKERVSWT
jgi:hypothetical protein